MEYTNRSIHANYPVKNGRAILLGIVVEEREKAIKIDFAIEPIFASGFSYVLVYTHSAWIPKTVIEEDGWFLRIKNWFVPKMRSHWIKHYYLSDGNKIFINN